MPLIIDGHNLIAKLPHLDLAEVDDETRLIELLQEYCRVKRKQAEVYFDSGAPGQPRARILGNVTVHFARQGRTADQAICARLRRLAGEARNWDVVSSDHEVQAAARAARARVIPSETFAQRLLATLQPNEEDELHKPRQPDDQELKEWLKWFGIPESDSEEEGKI